MKTIGIIIFLVGIWVITTGCNQVQEFRQESADLDLKIQEQPSFVEICIQDTGVGIKGEDLDRIFATMSTYIASTQYLCNPTDPAEMIFRKEWIKYYYGRPPLIGRPVAMMDLGFSLDKSACYTATVVVGQDEHGCWYVLDAVRGHLDTHGQKNMFFSLCELWKPSAFCMENVLFQDKMLDNIREDPRYHMLAEWGIAFFGEKPLKGESKDQRIEYLQPRVRNGMILFRKEQTEIIQELTRYRRKSASIKDLIDAMAYIARLMPPPEGQRPAKVFTDEAGLEDALFDDIERGLLYGDDDDIFSNLNGDCYE